MITLDQAWKQYLDNARASYKVSMGQISIQARDAASIRSMLAGQLAICEATFALMGMISELDAYRILVRMLRDSFGHPSWGDLPGIVREIDLMFSRIQNWNVEMPIDAHVALGWLARSTLFLAAGMVDKANESGTNTLDAITRVVIRTGHLRSDLMILMRELGLVHV